jgi:hypothetical protein
MDDLPRQQTSDVTGEKTSPARSVSLLRRTGMLAAVLAGAAMVYGLMLAQFDLSKGPVETEFGASFSETPVRLYLQPLQIDPVNASLQIRISVVPDPSQTDVAATVADRDFVLKIQRGKQVEHVQVRAKQPLPEVSFDFDLDGGNIRDYPLDRYVSVVTLAASERMQDGTEVSLPIHVTAWEGVLGFNVKGQVVSTQQSGELRLQFTTRRTGAFSFFGIAIYAAMIVMTLCALIIGGLVFIGVRKIEVTLAGALGAVIFALPALRQALPGTPPLGVRADVLVFFWAELGAIIALCLFVAAWARRGAPP